MDLNWILVVVAGWAIGMLFVFVLMRMSGNRDRAARHEQKRIAPPADVTTTKIDDPKNGR